MAEGESKVTETLLEAVAALLKEVKDLKSEQKVVVPLQQSNEVSVDALSRGISPFSYAPEQNLTFDMWYQRYKSTFLLDGKNLDDAARVRLLLRRLDASSYERYASNLLPREPANLSFDENVANLIKLFGKGESLFCTRRKCLQLILKDTDDLTTHAGVVNRHCEAFKLAECTADHFKALIFVNSLQSEKYVLVREQLLTKLETEPADKITLNFMVEEARRLINVKSDSRLDTPVASVSVLKKKDFAPKKDKPPRPCYLCGSMHFVKDCSYVNSKCSECGKVGHKNGYCPSFPQDSDKKKSTGKKYFAKKKKQSNQARTNAVFSPRSPGRKYLSPRINGHTIEFQLDCAADVSIISADTWRKFKQPSLTPISLKVRDAQSHYIEILGEFECSIRLGENEVRGRCLVSEKTSGNLFGIEWIEALGLWDYAPSSYCNSVQQEIDTTSAIKELQSTFPVVFGTEMGQCTKATASIHLKPHVSPVFRPKRPVAFHLMATIDDELQRLQASGFITPTEYSSWAAPIVVARKPNGRIRICGDYSTGLNESVEMNNHPIPDPDSLFSQFANKRVFSHIDLSDAYLQIPMDEESSQLLTIHTHRGLFRFNRLPPGIRSAPGIFQEIVERMLQGIPGVISYFDDICVASSDTKEHFAVLKEVFKRLEDYNFRVKLEKCRFFSREIKFLGVVADEKGLHPDPDKTEAICKMPAPSNVSELRSFLGAVQFWGRFIRSMSEIRTPLDRLLKKGVPWKWTAECQAVFKKFKEIITSDLLLTHYDPNLPIVVASDASSYAIGSVAYHQYPDGTQKAFYHASRRLTETEQRYSQIEKEGLGIVYALKKFHRFIYGRRFTLLTDHKPLVSIFGSKKGIPVHTANRLQRWSLILQSYDFEIKFISTDSFGHADVLSRLISASRPPLEEVVIAEIQLEETQDRLIVEEASSRLPVNFNMIKRATQSSESLQDVVNYIKGGWPTSLKSIRSKEVAKYFKIRNALSLIHDCVFYRERIVVPEQFRKKIITQLHDAHPGMSRMKSIARGYVFWPGIDSEIEQKVKSCTDCASAAKTPVKAELASWPLATHPWERIHLDYAKYRGETFLLIIDAYSKWPEIFRTPSSTTTQTIQKLRETFARNGLPETIVSDNGTQFVSDEFEEFCRMNGIKHLKTNPYCPYSNGQCERLVDSFKRSLEKQGRTISLDVGLQRFLANYRTTPNENSPDGKSPSEVLFSRKVRTIFDLLKFRDPQDPQRNKKMEEQYNRKHGAKKRSFQRGEEVYAKKFFQGGKFTWAPGTVIERRGSVSYNVRLSDGIIIRSHINQLRGRSTNSEKTTDSLPLFFAPSDAPTHPTPRQSPNSADVPKDSSTGSNNSTPIATTSWKPTPIVASDTPDGLGLDTSEPEFLGFPETPRNTTPTQEPKEPKTPDAPIRPSSSPIAQRLRPGRPAPGSYTERMRARRLIP
ncbi:uncharacterized protein K02A2.6-like [Phlebotomus papatasi]|uniref:uncharacterized protein K02A2.6-like n=1 Tax=Phlebotomus papatasi TaxID=29031 RepID=UPI002483F262|nr:uncharacterized protein K02A2.6-like [Phlebotomus papatasi]